MIATRNNPPSVSKHGTTDMPIDNCPHTFEQLSKKVLPNYFSELKKSIQNPLKASELDGYKSATKKALSKIGKEADFPGCYVFLDAGKPMYVGISRKLVRRLTSHLNHNTHYSASLVYKMASKERPHKMTRNQAMEDSQFQKAFLAKQKQLKRMAIAFVEIQNDLELYLFEAFACMKLNTEEWNSFRTH